MPNFELMGSVNAVSTREASVLCPDPAASPMSLARSYSYKGEIFVDKQLSVVYGITFAVSIENIKDFINDNRRVLEDKGFNLVIP